VKRGDREWRVVGPDHFVRRGPVSIGQRRYDDRQTDAQNCISQELISSALVHESIPVLTTNHLFITL
jgi:hypothetical protein